MENSHPYALILPLIKRGCSYVVYAHVLDDEVIYVGCGSPLRPFHMSGRNRKWNTKTSGNRPNVRILSGHKKKSAALRAELKFIEFFKPFCNSKEKT